jgi:colanic acid/amylovoran biosynthesis glycosyltransferase
MENRNQKKIVIVFTKNFPFGRLETYINSEIDILAKTFDKVILVPVDEYRYEHPNHNIRHYNNIDIVRINEFDVRLTKKEKLFHLWQALLILINEILFGRSSKDHCKHFKKCINYLLVAMQQSKSLYTYLHNNRLLESQFVFYSYWLHKSVLCATFLNNRLPKEVNIVSRAHSSDLYHRDWNNYIKLKVNPFLPFERFKIISCNKIFSISTHGYNHFLNVFPHYHSKFQIARLGTKQQSMLNPKNEDTVFRIVTCSAIFPNKRIFRMPEILSMLTDLRAEWVHIGWGDSESVRILNEEIDRYDVRKNVTLLGQKNHEFIIDYYRANPINIFMNLSLAEGIPVSIMEAISFGIPCIATNTIGNPEIVDNTCGFIIPVNFESANVASIIRKLSLNPSVQRELSLGAIQMFNTKYNADINYSHFSSILIEHLS